VLERLTAADAARASASIPFLLTVRGLQDAVSGGGDEAALRRLRDHLRASA
jgi:hypothetical protein